MIEIEGAINYDNHQIRVWKSVSEKEQTTWYTHVVIGERTGTVNIEAFIGVSGKSKEHVLLETGYMLHEHLSKK